jgi:hypothetical protein
MFQVYGVFSGSAGRDALLRRALEHAPAAGEPVRVSLPSATIAFLPRAGDTPGATLLHAPPLSVAVLGKPFHRDGGDLRQTLAFVRDAYLADRREAFAEISGEFVIVVADDARDRLVIISDCLALRPFFYAHGADGTAFGSEVWPLAATGCVPTTVDLDALCSWLCFEHVMGDASLIAGIRRIPPSSVLTIDGSGIRTVAYATLHDTEDPIGEDDLIDRIHEIVHRTCRQISDREPRLGCFLSGGFDSRYLACALSALRDDLELYTVCYDSREEDVAAAVARALGIAPHTIRTPSAVWDLWDDPFYVAPWGFPAWRFVTTLPVERFGLRHTLVDGLLGDDVIRGHDYEEAVARLAREHGSLDEAIFLAHLAVSPGVLFADPLARRIHGRVVRQIHALRGTMPGGPARQAYLWLLLHRKNTFHVTNHLHNVARLETVHPFCARDLLDLRLRHPNALFSTRLYRRIFARYYPAVSTIPHSTEVPQRYDRLDAMSRTLWRHTPAVTRELLRAECDGLFRRRWLLPRLAAYAGGMRRQQYLVRFLWPVAMLLRRLRSAGIEVPWDEI